MKTYNSNYKINSEFILFSHDWELMLNINVRNQNHEKYICVYSYTQHQKCGFCKIVDGLCKLYSPNMK